MPSREEVAYFGAGPAPMPTPVLEQGARAFLNFEDSGLSLAEISHRSPTANKILADTRAALASLLEIPDSYEILFMHGGGSGEFSAVVYNMVAMWVEKRRQMAERELGDAQEEILEKVKKEVREEMRLDYIVSGSWSLKASQEAANLLEPLKDGGKVGNLVNIVTDAREWNDGKFGKIPHEDTWKLTSPKASVFTYYCDNETVDGVEFPSFPKCLEPKEEGDDRLVVADMSSNFLSRRVDVSKYAVIYGGAQKNIGITDVTLVIVRQDILAAAPSPSFLHDVGIWSPPAILNWSIIAKNNSLYNTMPIFSIWIAGQVMRSLLSTHDDAKVAGQEAVANAKAEIIYRILDSNPSVYQVVPEKSVRSRMNICFRIEDDATEKEFLQGAEGRMLQGLKGHRSVGGIRISNYNAVPMVNVQKLASYLEDFAQRKR
ncbi:hypothetical protein N7G274_008117 [Stereocaulon virgatum]|uniref:phosphoserine transaminase n=1 Tax=Stereocaulon virgatum TaxID=373712 RepID=A0ABR4A6V7_9LECA